MSSIADSQKLINEADAKFEEKFKLVQRGEPTNLNVYADRTYNLRQQIAHSASLTNDDHFMELLADTERYLSADYTVRGELDRKLTAMLAGLLKTLLRETVALPSFAIRKMQVEMIWQWYQDKQRAILNFALLRRPELDEPSPTKSATDATSPEKALQYDDAKSRSLTDADVELQAAAETTTTQKAQQQPKRAWEPMSRPCAPLSFTSDASRLMEQHAIEKKMGLYKKRNLARAEKLRHEVWVATPDRPMTAPVPEAPRIVLTKEAREREAKKKESRFSGYERPREPSGPPSYLHVRGNTAPDFVTNVKDANVTREAALGHAQKHWVRRMIARVEEENDARAMKDVLACFSFNQARIEEESNRRIESDSYASQAGRTCHTILRRVPRSEQVTTTDGAAPVTAQSQQPSTQLHPDDLLEMLGRVVYQGTDASLSPYDYFQPTPLDEQRLQRMMSAIVAPDASKDAHKLRRGIKSPHPRSVAGTSFFNNELDVALTAETQTTPVQPRTDVPFLEQLIPALRAEEDVPSLNRIEQMRTVERIRECFARARAVRGRKDFNVPRATIERAILMPDDRPYDECVRLLPGPGSFFPSNPHASKDAGKKPAKKKKAAK